MVPSLAQSKLSMNGREFYTDGLLDFHDIANAHSIVLKES
jgi:hypothetical protein